MDTYVKPEQKRKIRNAIFISWLDGSCGKYWKEYAEKKVWENREDDFESLLNQIYEHLDTLDKDLNRAYSNLSKRDLRKLIFAVIRNIKYDIKRSV
jgi:transcription termination factor NusB